VHNRKRDWGGLASVVMKSSDLRSPEDWRLQENKCIKIPLSQIWTVSDMRPKYKIRETDVFQIICLQNPEKCWTGLRCRLVNRHKNLNISSSVPAVNKVKTIQFSNWKFASWNQFYKRSNLITGSCPVVRLPPMRLEQWIVRSNPARVRVFMYLYLKRGWFIITFEFKT
jgi:hypothetical protein